MDKRKMIGTILGGIFWIFCIIFFTYAFYTWRSENLVLNTNIEDQMCAVVEYDDSGIVPTEQHGPVLNPEDGVLVKFNATNVVDELKLIYVDLHISNIDDSLLSESFKYVIVKSVVSPSGEVNESTLEYNWDSPVAEGSFEDLVIGINTLSEDLLYTGSTNYYRAYFYIDGNIKNSDDLMNSSIEANFNIRCIDTSSKFATFRNAGNLEGTYIPISEGEEYGTLPTPIMEGYAFDGWYLEETYENEVTSSTIVATSDNVELYGKWHENIKPVATMVSSSALATTSQSVTLNCTDNVGVNGYYFGTNDNPSSSDYTSVASTTSMSVTKSVTAPGTYYLFAKDEAGNVSVASEEFSSYTVNNMLLTVSGTKNEYTTSNYTKTSSNSTPYILPTNTVLTLSDLYTVPTGSDVDNFKGVSVGTASATEAVPTKVEQSLGSGAVVYTMWFNRKEYPITVSSTLGGTNTVQNSRGTSVTARNGNNESITVRYGESITATATANTTYGFVKFTGLSTSTTSPVTITPNQSGIIGAVFESTDTNAPICTISTTTLLKSTSQTATLNCTDEDGVVSYYFGTSNNPSASDYTSISSTTSMSLTNTITNVGTYYLFAKDEVGNVSAATNQIYYSYVVNNMLLNVSGTSGTYTSSNYTQTSTGTYIAPSGTSLTLASVYTIPSNANSSSFKGVSTGAASTTAATVSTTVPILSANTTYTMWFDRITYTVSYNANGGTGAPAEQSKRAEADLTLSSVKPTRTGHTFLGWGTSSNATSASYQPGGTYSSDTSITLYALWRINKVYIKYHMNSGTWGGSTNSTLSYSGDYVTLNGSTYVNSYDYGTTDIDLPNYDDSGDINITRTNYKAITGKEWIKDGTTTTFNDDSSSVTAAELCDASAADCTVVLKVNWVQANYSIVKSSVTHYYSTLESAINDADEAGGNTITLLRSITDTSTVTFDKNLTFTTNGKTLTRNATMIINSGVTLTIPSGNTGTINNTGSGNAGTAFRVDGNLTASGGTIKSSTTNVIWNNAGTVTISGATITGGTATNTRSVYAIINGQTGTLNVTSGSISGYNAINNYAGGTVTISGGTFSSTDTSRDMIRNNGAGTITISGGTFSPATGVQVLHATAVSTGTVTITGGTMTSTDMSTVQNAGTGTIALEGGTVTSNVTAIYNSGTGFMRVGVTGNTKTMTIQTNRSADGNIYAAFHCGDSSSGSKAICIVNRGATISSNVGPAVTNWNGSYNQYNGSYIYTTSTSTAGALYNRGTTYTSGTVGSTTYYYGRVYVRQGKVEGPQAAIYSKGTSNHAVYIGNVNDTIFRTWSSTATEDGPFLVGTGTSAGAGILIDSESTGFVYNNGVIGGKAYNVNSDISAIVVKRTDGYTLVDNSPTSGGFKYLRLNKAS